MDSRGYNGEPEPFPDFVREHLGATVEVAKRNERHTFTVIPKRNIAWLSSP